MLHFGDRTHRVCKRGRSKKSTRDAQRRPPIRLKLANYETGPPTGVRSRRVGINSVSSWAHDVGGLRFAQTDEAGSRPGAKKRHLLFNLYVDAEKESAATVSKTPRITSAGSCRLTRQQQRFDPEC